MIIPPPPNLTWLIFATYEKSEKDYFYKAMVACELEQISLFVRENV